MEGKKSCNYSTIKYMIGYQRPRKGQIFLVQGCKPGVFEKHGNVLGRFLQKGAKIMTKHIQIRIAEQLQSYFIIGFVLMITSVTQKLEAQDLLFYRYTKDLKQEVRAGKAILSSGHRMQQTPAFVVSPAVFCRLERSIEQNTGRQILLRLVSVDEIERMEGKRRILPDFVK